MWIKSGWDSSLIQSECLESIHIHSYAGSDAIFAATKTGDAWILADFDQRDFSNPHAAAELLMDKLARAFFYDDTCVFDVANSVKSFMFRQELQRRS